jgi:Tfp pilus assembly protein PilX
MLVAKTSLEHQNQRVSELEAKLQAAEARLRDYERPIGTGGANDTLSEEERLKQEIMKLR